MFYTQNKCMSNFKKYILYRLSLLSIQRHPKMQEFHVLESDKHDLKWFMNKHDDEDLLSNELAKWHHSRINVIHIVSSIKTI